MSEPYPTKNIDAKLNELIRDDSVSTQEKIRQLEDWRLDLLEKQRATEENMRPSSAGDGENVGEDLRRVTEALADLQESPGSGSTPG